MKRSREIDIISDASDAIIEPPAKKLDKKTITKQIFSEENTFYETFYSQTTTKNQEIIKSLLSIYEKNQGLRLTFNMDIVIPELVIIGSQSVGKSSFIDALLGRKFNMVKSQIGTVCPIIIRMENDATYEEPFCMFYKDDKPDELEETDVHIDAVSEHIEKRSKKRQKEEKSIISPKPIILKIKYKECVNIIVYDTPGFRRRNVDDTDMEEDYLADENISEKIESMVMDIISDKSKTIVALEQSSIEWCDMDIIEKVKKVDPKLDRTIAIITKFDQRSTSFTDSDSAQKYILSGVKSLGIRKDKIFFVSLPFGSNVIDIKPKEYLDLMKKSYLKDMINVRLFECKPEHGIHQIGFVRARDYLQNHMIDQYKSNLKSMHEKFCDIISSEEEKTKECETKLKDISHINIRQLIFYVLSLFCSNIEHVLKGDIHFKVIESNETNQEFGIDIQSIGMSSIEEWEKYFNDNMESFEKPKRKTLDAFGEKKYQTNSLWCDKIWGHIETSPVNILKKTITPVVSKKRKSKTKDDDSSSSDSDTSISIESDKKVDDEEEFLRTISFYSEEEEKKKSTLKKPKEIPITLPINPKDIIKKFEDLKIKTCDQIIYGNNQFERLMRECALVVRSKILPICSISEINTIVHQSVYNHDLFEGKGFGKELHTKPSSEDLENATKRIEQMKKFNPYICQIVQSKSKQCLMPVIDTFIKRFEYLIDHTIDVNMKFLMFYLKKKDVFMSHYKKKYDQNNNNYRNEWNENFVYQTSDIISLITRHKKNDEDEENILIKHLNLKNVYDYFSKCAKMYKTKILNQMKDDMENEFEAMVNSLYEQIEMNPRTLQPYIGKIDNSILYYMKWKDQKYKLSKKGEKSDNMVNSFLIEYIHHLNNVVDSKKMDKSAFQTYSNFFEKQIPENSDHHKISQTEEYILGNSHMVFEYVKNEFINQMIRCYKNMVVDKINLSFINWLKNEISSTYNDEFYENMLGIEKRKIQKELEELKKKIEKLKIQKQKMIDQFAEIND